MQGLQASPANGWASFWSHKKNMWGAFRDEGGTGFASLYLPSTSPATTVTQNFNGVKHD
jgi:hypothetical protein